MEESLEYLGHKIDATGLHTTTRKMEAISQAPQPKNIQELRSYLGLLHYYGKFLPNLATLLHPLNNLLKTGCKWTWIPECTRAYKASKKLLVTAPVLAHYDPALPMKMAGDASAYGLGPSSRMYSLMAVNVPLLLRPAHCPHQSVTMRKSLGRPCPWCMAFRSFTSTYMAVDSP